LRFPQYYCPGYVDANCYKWLFILAPGTTEIEFVQLVSERASCLVSRDLPEGWKMYPLGEHMGNACWLRNPDRILMLLYHHEVVAGRPVEALQFRYPPRALTREDKLKHDRIVPMIKWAQDPRGQARPTFF
jgi:hypothetical protein